MNLRIALRQLVREYPTIALICNRANLGLAAGLNIGAREALLRFPSCQFLVFLDQDTEPGMTGIERLVQATTRLRTAGHSVGVVGPQIVDAETGLSHGVHVMRAYRWTRDFPRPGATEALSCASVNGSGSVVPSEIFRALGGFDERLFIDHVDSEWSFRVSAAGYRLYTIPDVSFTHRMGARTIRFWLGGVLASLALPPAGPPLLPFQKRRHLDAQKLCAVRLEILGGGETDVDGLCACFRGSPATSASESNVCRPASRGSRRGRPVAR